VEKAIKIMDANSVKLLLLSATLDFGSALLLLIGACLVIGVGVLIFKIGWGWLHDQSYSLGGYYLHNLPYAGYKRFRSKKWNMEHMP